MLAALATLHPKPLTRRQIGTFVVLPSHGSTFTSYLSALRKAGYIDENGELVSLTESGLASVGSAPPAPSTTEEMVAMWSAKLKAGARQMLAHLVANHPGAVTRQALGEAVGLPASGSTFTSYLSALRKNELIQENGAEVRASDTLFIDGVGRG
jgi:hypothetical protein